MNNPEMADIDEKYKTKKFYKEPKRKIKASAFKRNVPKRLRQEWGQRMNHLRSIV